jgi:hypothetical protein
MPTVIALLTVLLLPAMSGGAATTPEGTWGGTLTTGAQQIGVVIHLLRTTDGSWTGSIDTPSQHSFGLPLSSVQVDGAQVIAECSATGAAWEAELSADGQSLAGAWTQRGSVIPLTCERGDPPPPVPSPLRGELIGTWEGPLELGAVQLRLVLVLDQISKTAIGGFMVSPDQSPDEIPIGRVAWEGDRSVRVLIGSLAASFNVTLPSGGDSLIGTFAQGAASFPIDLKRVAKPTVVNRPQEPRPPFPYRVEDVVYRNEADDVTLAGTLTIPEGSGPVPAALLITGSGPQDRNEEIFQHKPFWVIADHLTRRGIAVLRVDDRGVGGSSAGPHPGTATSHDFARDVEAGLSYLASRPEIDEAAIGLIGHSEGGIIAPIVASRQQDIAYIVLMAGTGVRGDELLLAQTAAIGRADGASEDEIAASAATNRALFDVLLSDPLSQEETADRMRRIIESNPEFAAATPEEQQLGMNQAIAQLNTNWMRAFAAHDPAVPLSKVSCPVLAINGELDLQVPADQNLPAIASALASGGNSDVTTRAFPGLNHLFQHSETGLISEYGQIEETISPEVLECMATWIRSRVDQGPNRPQSDK